MRLFKHETGGSIPSLLAASVARAIRQNQTLQAPDVEVAAEGDVITLEGRVDTYWTKARVDEIALDVPGVRRTINRIAIAPSERLGDQAIARAVITALGRTTLLDPELIDVLVVDGVVTLSGAVPSWIARQAALEIARLTSGVAGIRDRLVVFGQRTGA